MVILCFLEINGKQKHVNYLQHRKIFHWNIVNFLSYISVYEIVIPQFVI